jgi:Zn-dependent protease with chaperone function
MNFFEHQRLARRNSRIMVVLFAAAVLAVVVAVDVVLGALYAWSAGEAAPAAVYVAGAAATAALILCVSLFNVARLAEGGVAVARMIGARRVTSGTTDLLERRLCNVVEEMAIASGVRVPEVYVMDGERGINAFAAGWDTSSAVVAVTRGTLQTLTRDELQGVVAHEFSHILNGDMRLNVRMLGVLAGIVFIGSVGEFVMRSARGCARLIKAAVSREREFLADASSVQFTRNPDGIAGALDQIRVSSAGTLIANRYAEEMSHMFFGAAVTVRLARLFDTHPPLDERIRRVHPQFQRSEYHAKRVAALPLEGERFAAAIEQKGRRGSDFAAAWGRTPGESAALVGTLDPGKMEFAGRLLAALPQPLRESVRSVDGARAVMLALLLAEPEEAMRSQLEAIGNTDNCGAGARDRGARARPWPRVSPSSRSLRSRPRPKRRRTNTWPRWRRWSTPTGASRCTSSSFSRSCVRSLHPGPGWPRRKGSRTSRSRRRRCWRWWLTPARVAMQRASARRSCRPRSPPARASLAFQQNLLRGRSSA